MFYTTDPTYISTSSPTTTKPNDETTSVSYTDLVDTTSAVESVSLHTTSSNAHMPLNQSTSYEEVTEEQATSMSKSTFLVVSGTTPSELGNTTLSVTVAYENEGNNDC